MEHVELHMTRAAREGRAGGEREREGKSAFLERLPLPSSHSGVAFSYLSTTKGKSTRDAPSAERSNPFLGVLFTQLLLTANLLLF